MLIGGFSLFILLRCDQTKHSGCFSAKMKNHPTITLANGLLRFPVVLVYCTMGLIIGALVVSAPILW